MTILLLSTSSNSGGAAVAASRLMQALRKRGITVKMLVRDKQTDDGGVYSLNRNRCLRIVNWCRFVLERFLIFVANGFSRKNLFQVSVANTGTDISRHPWVREADVVHLHWINQGMLSIRDIESLLSTGKPVVWTLHDMWPATGICHYAGDCRQYQSSCGICPMQASHPLWNLASWTFGRKRRAGFERIFFVGCSRWIVSACEQSALLRSARFKSIPNPIDVSIFHPCDRVQGRKLRDIPQDRQVLLFAAAKLSDLRKGARFLVEACRLISQERDDVVVLLMGSHAEELREALPVPVYSLGYLSSAPEIAGAYAIADVFVTPSLEDNLPNTIMEALACGTPCVAFRTGGIPEMISHLETGYVASCASAEDLAKGILWVLNHPDKKKLSESCLQKVRRDYTEEEVARKYEEIYRSLCY